MFLFEGCFGNVLHTGDCRLTPEYLQRLPEKYLGKKGKKPRCQLDYVFLDCTFGKYYQSFPSKHSAIQQVLLLGSSCTCYSSFCLLLFLLPGLIILKDYAENGTYQSIIQDSRLDPLFTQFVFSAFIA